jgi:hypothetical protein
LTEPGNLKEWWSGVGGDDVQGDELEQVHPPRSAMDWVRGM